MVISSDFCWGGSNSIGGASKRGRFGVLYSSAVPLEETKTFGKGVRWTRVMPLFVRTSLTLRDRGSSSYYRKGSRGYTTRTARVSNSVHRTERAAACLRCCLFLRQKKMPSGTYCLGTAAVVIHGHHVPLVLALTTET